MTRIGRIFIILRQSERAWNDLYNPEFITLIIDENPSNTNPNLNIKGKNKPSLSSLYYFIVVGISQKTLIHKIWSFLGIIRGISSQINNKHYTRGGTSSLMFANCSVFGDVREVRSSVFGQNHMFGHVRSSILMILKNIGPIFY